MSLLLPLGGEKWMPPLSIRPPSSAVCSSASDKCCKKELSPRKILPRLKETSLTSKLTCQALPLGSRIMSQGLRNRNNKVPTWRRFFTICGKRFEKCEMNIEMKGANHLPLTSERLESWPGPPGIHRRCLNDRFNVWKRMAATTDHHQEFRSFRLRKQMQAHLCRVRQVCWINSLHAS